jgi:hypothetical protein
MNRAFMIDHVQLFSIANRFESPKLANRATEFPVFSSLFFVLFMVRHGLNFSNP